jgi:hypothetical protein
MSLILACSTSSPPADEIALDAAAADTAGGGSAMGGASPSGGAGGTSAGGTSGSGGAGATGGAQHDAATDTRDASSDALRSDAGCMNVPGVCYSTNFALDEKPIWENGAWTHVGLDWATVQTFGGKAFGTQTGSGGYDDSYAHLSGFPPDVSVSATIYKAAGIPAGDIHEVELHLRWADAVHNARGYECLLHHNGNYAQIVRWEGGLGKFTYIAYGASPAPKTGDVLSATAVGNVITFYLNGAKIAQATDATWAAGDPGMGFYRESSGTNTLYGFSSYSVQAL